MKFPLQALYGFYRNAIRNPKYRWWIILGTLVYLLSPFDISPDMFPIAGQIDDVLLVTLMFTEVSTLLMEKIKRRDEDLEGATSDSATRDAQTVDVDAVSLD
ncbi:MAG: YkvA family protein [Synechocystis sp.]|nr:YkvA family protein [Synechocystis sp.]